MNTIMTKFLHLTPGARATVLLVALLVAQAQAPARAQTTTAEPAPAPAAAPAAYEPQAHPNMLDGSLSVLGDLAEDNAVQSSFMRRPTALDPWFAWKNTLRAEHGLNIGGSWGLLWQNYSSSPINQKNAVGSKFTFNLSYALTNRGQPDALTFDMAVEDRRPVGTDLPPLWAGIGAGSMIPTAATWGEFDLGVTQAYIRQSLLQNSVQYTVGKIFAPNFIDAYPFFDDNRQFLSQAFSTSPTIASPLRGFGMVGTWFPTEDGLYLKPGMFTSHSSDTGSTVGDFFSKNDHFYMFEAGWSGLARSGVPIQARGPMDANNIHLTAWYKDAMDDGSAPRSYGLAFNANYMVGDNLMWFARAGWSEGWAADRAASAGFGWRPSTAPSDLFGVGVGWVRPAFTALRSQYTAEVFYRFHVTPNFAITPDVQVQVHPALNPAVNALWVFSLRARLAF